MLTGSAVAQHVPVARWRRHIARLAAGALLGGLGVAAQAAPPVAAAAGTQFVYVANLNANSVTAYNAATGTVAATIPVSGTNPRYIAVTPDGRTAYVTSESPNGSGSAVSVISTLANTVTATIATGSGPFHLAITPDGRSVYVPNTFSPRSR